MWVFGVCIEGDESELCLNVSNIKFELKLKSWVTYNLKLKTKKLSLIRLKVTQFEICAIKKKIIPQTSDIKGGNKNVSNLAL